jgi:hypothetical protein
LNTASENVQSHNLDVSNEWATPTARAPSRLNVHPRATNLILIPSIMAHTTILEDWCCGVCLQQTPLHPWCWNNLILKLASKILILQTAKLSMKHRCLEDGDMRLHNATLPCNPIASTWLALSWFGNWKLKSWQWGNGGDFCRRCGWCVGTTKLVTLMALMKN